MIALGILVVLTVIFIVQCTKRLHNNFIRLQETYEALARESGGLSQKHTELLRQNKELRDQLEKTIALYDISKEICKYLDEDKVFGAFKNRISSYIHVDECKFLKNDADLSAYQGCIVTPLEINKKPVGYLVASGVAENQKDEFAILTQQFVLGIKRAVLYQRVQELSITDTLTGVLTRRHWFERFTQELERSRKFKFDFSFLMIDIDHFKMINDRYGHLVGDAMLKEVSRRIKENIRQVDLICRYGGEEFSVILVETDKAGAQFAAERIRLSIAEKPIRAYDEDIGVTISIGISVFPGDAADAAAIVEKADRALYRAKQTGRNAVCVCGVS
jgi:diguanylate cyclase (GGDEF)-like protein